MGVKSYRTNEFFKNHKVLNPAYSRHRVTFPVHQIQVASQKPQPLLRVVSRQGQLMITNEDELMMSPMNRIHQLLHTLLAVHMLVDIDKHFCLFYF